LCVWHPAHKAALTAWSGCSAVASNLQLLLCFSIWHLDLFLCTHLARSNFLPLLFQLFMRLKTAISAGARGAASGLLWHPPVDIVQKSVSMLICHENSHCCLMLWGIMYCTLEAEGGVGQVLGFGMVHLHQTGWGRYIKLATEAYAWVAALLLLGWLLVWLWLCAHVLAVCTVCSWRSGRTYRPCFSQQRHQGLWGTLGFPSC
jgi:hypothetical protein